jgi:hydrogenase maturation protein HypF
MPKVEVQHHHAHIVSCMAEHKLGGEVIGLSFDGTGYGTDGAIWGGEVLVAAAHQFQRMAHLAYVPMPGGTAAIKEPWRMAVSYLHAAFGDDFRDLDLPILEQADPQKLKIIVEMMIKGVNSPPTSSLGRLFDGVAAITGIRRQVNFEGQAAMELEMLTAGDGRSVYDIEEAAADASAILPAPIIRGVVRDIQNGLSTAEIGAKFHRTIVALFAEVCTSVRVESELNRVVLSGGCFQNAILLAGLIEELESRKFEVFAHRQVPANDGGISLGQALVAAASFGC